MNIKPSHSSTARLLFSYGAYHAQAEDVFTAGLCFLLSVDGLEQALAGTEGHLLAPHYASDQGTYFLCIVDHGSPDLWVQATCHARHEHAAPTQGLLEPPATDASGPVASIRQSPRRGRGGGLERACPLWAAVVARRPNRKRAPTARRSGQRPCTAR